jgi:hypothetical protein
VTWFHPMPNESSAKRAHPPSSASSGVHSAVQKPRKTPPPVLASDILREDLAPIEPGGRATRVCHAVTAAILLGVAFTVRARTGLGGGGTNAGAICAAGAAAAAATALAPIGYRWRAAVGAAIGGAIMLLGLAGLGPLGAFDHAPGVLDWGGFRVIAAIALPAALLFRTYYRAYERGRTILAFAYAISVPFLVTSAFGIVAGPEITGQIASAVAVLVLLSGLFALRGTPPTSITAYVAGLFIVAATFDLLFDAPGRIGLSRLLAGLVMVACVAPTSLGLFQLLASAYAPDARKVDVHRPTEPDLPLARPSQGE